MKFQTIVLAVLVNGICFGLTLAETAKEDHDAHHPATADLVAPSSMDKSAAKDPVVKGGAPKMDEMQQMQGNMEKMQGLMKKIQLAKSPEEHQKLMKQHMDMMQDNMKMMKDMKGMGMMPEVMMGDKSNMPMDENKMAHEKMCSMEMMSEHMGMMKMMMDRMEMMQMMMDQMVQHQAAQK